MDARNSLSAQCVSAEKKPGEISQEKIKYNQDRERTMDDFVVSSQKENSSEIFPFVCGLCDSKFSRIVPYYKHLRQHEEIYKESFFDCNKECKENNSAKYQPYHCAICNIGFVTICQLHFHIIEEENIDIYVYEQRSRMVRPVNLDFGHQSASGKVSEQIMSASKLEPTSKNSGESNTYKSDRANDHEQKIILNVPETCSERIVSDSKRKSSKPPKYGNVDKKCKKHLPTQMPQHTCQRKCLKKSGSDKITKAAVDLQIKQEDEYGICEESSKPDNCSIGNDVSQQESVVVETEPDVDLRIFKRIEKYQMELKKRREKYRKKVKERAMQQKMEKSFAEAGTSICNEKDKNAELSDTQTSIRNEEEIHALVNNVHSNGSHSKANDDGMTRCKTQPEEMDTEIVAKDAEPQIKKTPTNSQADHTGQKVFANDMLIPCHICGRMYKKRHMGNHLVSHQETRSFQCDVCNKYYKTKTQLQLHKEHHEAERNFVCRFCGKAFNTKGRQDTIPIAGFRSLLSFEPVSCEI